VSDATLRIKNLSIALEALHRTPECGDLAASVWLLLKQEVAEAEKEKTEARQWPRRPAKPAPNFVNPDDVAEI